MSVNLINVQNKSMYITYNFLVMNLSEQRTIYRSAGEKKEVELFQTRYLHADNRHSRAVKFCTMRNKNFHFPLK